MIAFDTNVLVRHYLTDPEEPAQSEKARRLVENALTKGQTIYISHIVICESLWVLGDCYKIARSAQIEFLESLLHDEPFRVSGPEIISMALKVFKNSKVDFADCLIGMDAKSNGCAKTFTFDKKAKVIPGMELVK